MTIREFQKINGKRCIEAFKHSTSDWSLLEWAGALAGEVGEAANITKKILRREQGIGGDWAKRDPEMDVMRQQLGEEIGDIFAYLVLLAEAAGLDAEQCAAAKFDAVSDKVHWDGPRLTLSESPT